MREESDLLLRYSSEGEEVLEITRESGDGDDGGAHPSARDRSPKRSSGRLCRPSKRLREYDVY